MVSITVSDKRLRKTIIQEIYIYIAILDRSYRGEIVLVAQKDILVTTEDRLKIIQQYTLFLESDLIIDARYNI